MNPILRIKKRTWIGCLPLLLVGLSYGDARPAYSLPLFDEDEYDFQLKHRINAHGDEFMSLALMSDGRGLVIGTEGGKLLVWGIAENRIVKQFDQGSPVHCVVASSDPQTVIAAGGPHSASSERGLVRKWNIETGEFKEFTEAGAGTITSLAIDGRMIAIGGNHRDVALYDANKGERLMYFQTEASDFYVTNVWLLGNRLIFTTDAGVLKDGEIQR